MSSVFKPTYLRPIPHGAENCEIEGRAAVRYVDRRGREHIRLLNSDGTKMICEQRRWWMRYALSDGIERRTKGFHDKRASELEAARLERQAERKSVTGESTDEEQGLYAILRTDLATDETLKRLMAAKKYNVGMSFSPKTYVELIAFCEFVKLKRAVVTELAVIEYLKDRVGGLGAPLRLRVKELLRMRRLRLNETTPHDIPAPLTES